MIRHGVRPLLRLALFTALALPASASAQGAHSHGGTASPLPTEAGEALFGALSEIVALLDADPATDWSRIDIGALREHLRDMQRVMVETDVTETPLAGGVGIEIRGSEEVLAAARRMVSAHAAMVGADRGWSVQVDDRAGSLQLTWTTPRADEVERLRALGFYGLMVDGNHHRMHHLMIARGMDPHAGR